MKPDSNTPAELQRYAMTQHNALGGHLYEIMRVCTDVISLHTCASFWDFQNECLKTADELDEVFMKIPAEFTLTTQRSLPSQVAQTLREHAQQCLAAADAVEEIAPKLGPQPPLAYLAREIESGAIVAMSFTHPDCTGKAIDHYLATNEPVEVAAEPLEDWPQLHRDFEYACSMTKEQIRDGYEEIKREIEARDLPR